MKSDSPDLSSWYESRRFQLTTIAVLAVVVLIEGIVAVFFRENDYMVHWFAGLGFLDGEPHRNHQQIYLLGRIMFDGMVAALPYYLGRALVYLTATTMTVLLFVAWRHIADQLDVSQKSRGPIAFAAAAATLAILYPYVIRDLDDAGPHLILLAFASLGAWGLVARRQAFAGASFALAATIKTTGLLFLPYLIYKRRFRSALAMVGFLALFNAIMPACYLGVATTWRSLGEFVHEARSVAATRDPSQISREKPRPQNQSLTVAMGRYLTTVEPGHPLHIDHPGFLQFGRLKPDTALLVTKGLIVLLGLFLAWRFWRPLSVSPGDVLALEVAREIPVLTILAALLSPICWLQHLVAMIPALFLEIRRLLVLRAEGSAMQRQDKVRLAVVVMIGVIVLLLQRDIVQKDLSVLLLSYKVDTLGALLALGLSLSYPLPRRVHANGASIAPTLDSNSREAQTTAPQAA